MEKHDESDEKDELGVISLKELEDAQVVQSEFLSSVFKPKVTLNYDSITFNSSCVRLFEEVEHVLILMDANRRRIVLIPCQEHEKNAFKWCKIKDGRKMARTSSARIFGGKIFEMMEWKKENRYKPQAIYQEVDGRPIIVFNLNESEMVQPETITRDDGKKVYKCKKFYPEEWRNSFGMTYREHKESYKVDINANYVLYNTHDGTDNEFDLFNKTIKGKEVDPTDIMTRKYTTHKKKKHNK